MDAHEPYRPPHPFNGHYLNSEFPHLYGLKQYLRFVNRQYYKNQWGLYQFSQYKGAVEYIDSQLGNLFDHLKKLGIYETSLIIITSDHGEFFGEHGYYTHRKPMYEEEIKVPLLIKYPFKQRIGLVKERVTLKNLYPTILSLCHMPIPDYLAKETLERSSSSIISELYDFNFKTQRNIYSRNYKYMYFKEGKSPELYDLDKDPQETNNLAVNQKAIKAQMACSLKAVENRLRPYYKTEQGEGEEIKGTLKALGYIQ
jgi:arylsulfatase A-like enzyme